MYNTRKGDEQDGTVCRARVRLRGRLRNRVYRRFKRDSRRALANIPYNSEFTLSDESVQTRNSASDFRGWFEIEIPFEMQSASYIINIILGISSFN